MVKYGKIEVDYRGEFVEFDGVCRSACRTKKRGNQVENWDEGENWKMDVKIEVTCEWNRWGAIPDIKKVLKCKVAPYTI